MKKRSRWLMTSSLLGLMLIVFCGMSFADSETSGKGKSMGLGLEAGYALFSEDNFGGAPAFGLNFFYNLSKNFRVELKGGFYPSKIEDDPEGLSQGTLNVIPLQLTLQYCFKLSSRVVPYLGAGAGYYLNNFSIENEDVWQDLGYDISEKVDSVFGFHLNAGIDYFLNANMAFNIDIRFCTATLTGTFNITEVVSGISHNGDIEGELNYYFFGAGIKFLF